MRSHSRILAVSLSLIALASAMAISRNATAGDTSTAEHLFQQGLDAMKKNQFKEACDAFGGSNEADPSPGTEINLALCNEKQGKLATAWGWYRTAGGLAEQRGQKERAELARKEADKLEPKLHKLVISVKSPAEGLTVTRNGAPVPHAVLGTDVPIDPGDYAIEVSAKGKTTWKQSVKIAAGPGTDRLDVPPLLDAPVEAPSPLATSRDSGAPIAPARDGSGQRNLGFVLGGAGIVAGIVAVSLEFLALREDDKSKEASQKLADPGATLSADDQRKLSDSVTSHKDAATSDKLGAVIVGAGGVVLIGVGITLILTAPSGPAKSGDLDKTRLTPLLGKGLAGLGLRGTF